MSSWGPQFGSKNVTTHFPPPFLLPQALSHITKRQTKARNTQTKIRDIVTISWEWGATQQRSQGPMLTFQLWHGKRSWSSSEWGPVLMGGTHASLKGSWWPVHPNRYGRELSKPNTTAALVVCGCYIWKTLSTPLPPSPNELCHLTHLLVPTNSTDC
jgi:hypothetical protein